MDYKDQKMRYPEVAALIGLPLGTVYTLVHRRAIPHIRLGRRLVVFSKADLERWLDDHRVNTTEGK